MANFLKNLGKWASGETAFNFAKDLINPENPAKSAMPYLDKASKLYDPYMQQGQQAGQQWGAQNAQMAQDPTAFLEQLMQNYQPSQGYQMKLDEGMRAAGNSAAAGGMRGTQTDIANSGRLAQSLMGDDMQQWLQNVLGIQGQGRAGQQYDYGQGYKAAGDLGNVYGSQGSLAFQGQQSKNQNVQDLFKAIMGGAGKAAGGAAGGGFM